MSFVTLSTTITATKYLSTMTVTISTFDVDRVGDYIINGALTLVIYLFISYL
jgi:hypothetical protein